MQLAISIVGAILAIFSIIILHEMGHFFVARLLGIKILRFSVGFGKALYTRIGKDGTEYVWALIPLGGYVKMLGESEAHSVPDEEMHRAFNRKPLYVRMAVVLAGPLTNFIFAIFMFWGAYLVGMENIKPIVGQVLPHSFAAHAGLQSGDDITAVGDKATHNWQQVIMALLMHMGDINPVKIHVQPKGANHVVTRAIPLAHWKINKRNPEIFATLGMFPYFPVVKPVILKVLAASPAMRAHLQAKDRVMALDGKSVSNWEELITAISRMPGKKIRLTVKRNGSVLQLPVQIGSQLRDKKTVGYLGVMVTPPVYPATMRYIEHYNVLTAWPPAVMKTWDLLKYNVIVLAKMLTAKLSVKTMGGPISIFQAAGQATQAGWGIYLSFIGFISLTIGFINLLPIPGLDGGHLLFQIIEAVICRPVPEKIQHYGFTLGMLFVLLVVIHATINDLLRIFG